MTVLDIVTLPNKILRDRTQPITQYDDQLQQLIDDMIDTMRDAPGVGLAAPQVGRSIKLTVIETLPEVCIRRCSLMNRLLLKKSP